MISLEHLLRKFKPKNDFDFEGKHFRTHVPSVAPKAYLNIFHDAADEKVQRETIDPLGLSDEIREFYRAYNGASLLSGSIHIVGFMPKTYFIDRSDFRKLPPGNIMAENEYYFDNVAFSEYLVFGSYYPDASAIFMQRRTGQVYCGVERSLAKTRATWPSFEVWLTEEMERLCGYFDESGNRLVELDEIPPKRS